MAEPLETLLVDVGGTLVNDATWVWRDQYEARLREALGAEHAWFGPLASHPPHASARSPVMSEDGGASGADR